MRDIHELSWLMGSSHTRGTPESPAPGGLNGYGKLMAEDSYWKGQLEKLGYLVLLQIITVFIGFIFFIPSWYELTPSKTLNMHISITEIKLLYLTISTIPHFFSQDEVLENL